MNFKELCAAFMKYEQALASISQPTPPDLQRIGPATHDDPMHKPCVRVRQIESNTRPGKIAIGETEGSMETMLTTTQCEWLRDVLMEWFPKDVPDTSCCMCRDRDARKCPEEIRAALFGVAEQAGKGNWFNVMNRVREVLRLCVAGLRDATTYRPENAVPKTGQGDEDD